MLIIPQSINSRLDHVGSTSQSTFRVHATPTPETSRPLRTHLRNEIHSSVFPTKIALEIHASVRFSHTLTHGKTFIPVLTRGEKNHARADLKACRVLFIHKRWLLDRLARVRLF